MFTDRQTDGQSTIRFRCAKPNSLQLKAYRSKSDGFTNYKMLLDKIAEKLIVDNFIGFFLKKTI